MLGTLDEEKKQAWPEYLTPMVHAYNSSKHAATGYTPFCLMFGRHPRLPIDIALTVNSEDPKQVMTAVYVKKLRRRL